MSYKFKAPADFRGTSFDIAGVLHNVADGVLECDENISHILAPFGFTRITDEPKPAGVPVAGVQSEFAPNAILSNETLPVVGSTPSPDFQLSQEIESIPVNIEVAAPTSETEPVDVVEVKKTNTKKTT